MLQITRRPLSALELERSPRRTEILHPTRQANEPLLWIAVEREHFILALSSSGKRRLLQFLRVSPVIIHL